MVADKTQESISQSPLRLWPGITAAILLIICKFGIPLVMPDALTVVMFGGLGFGAIIILWWAFFSRAVRLDRWGGAILLIIGLIAVRPLLHESIAEAGMGVLFFINAIPYMSLIFMVWAIARDRIPTHLQRATMLGTIILAVGFWTLIRTGGLNNAARSDYEWRWKASPEELLLSMSEEKSPITIVTADTTTAAEWPGFRGSRRDGVVHGQRIETDWTHAPPEELWRQPVGPGWSSFAVHGNVFYTQEQRGDDEAVSSYNLTTGAVIWRHSDAVRFWESNSGAGPRGTPTLYEGRVYTFGATGILNVLDASDGSRIWWRDVAAETETQRPYWGFASSPLIVEDKVIIGAAGSLFSYDRVSGDPLWSVPIGGDCYSSPHLAQIDGIDQILLQNQAGTMSVDPTRGEVLWEHPWPGQPIVQPVLVPGGDILVSRDDRTGIRRISAIKGPGGWISKERWTSDWLKPYFNDSAIHEDHVYGFNGASLACIALEDGAAKWRGGRYGRGQFILLADQDLILVLSEKGKLALIEADPGAFTEIASFKAIEGKTWNHPVLVDGILLVRNDREMAAFRLSPSEA